MTSSNAKQENNSSSHETTTDSIVSHVEDLRYGWKKLKPTWLQCCNRPIWALQCFCAASIIQSLAVSGFLGVIISSLEKRFDLNSLQSGLIPATYEAAGVLVLILVSYYGSNGHKPRWVAGGMFVLGLGSIIFAMPHFLVGNYQYSAQQIETFCQTGDGGSAQALFCTSQGKTASLTGFLAMFMIGHALHSLGSVPLHTLSVPYMDDMLSKEDVSLYIGAFYSMTVVGPALGYVVGGFLLSVYVDVGKVDMTSITLTEDDPRWVGAWWLGYILTFSLAMLICIPLCGFPWDMPGAADIRHKKESEVHSGSAKHNDMAFTSLRQLPTSLKILLKNPAYLFSGLFEVPDGLLISGYAAFGPKFIQNQYGLSPGMAAIVFGLVTVIGGLLGTVTASVITKKKKLSCSQLYKIAMVTTLFGMIPLGGYFIRCDDVPFAGVNKPYSGDNVLALNNTCNFKCGCSELFFDPVCGVDGLLYFSPCYAGCETETKQDGGMVYRNCSCITEGDSSAVAGVCSGSYCNLMPLFLVLFFFSIAILFGAQIFNVEALIRCVPESQRALALGTHWMAARLLGSIPGPLLIGAVLDNSCLLWEKKCEETGSCLAYSGFTMALSMFLVSTVCKLVGLLGISLAWKLYKPPPSCSLESLAVSNAGYGSRDDIANGKATTGTDNEAYELDSKEPVDAGKL